MTGLGKRVHGYYKTLKYGPDRPTGRSSKITKTTKLERPQKIVTHINMSTFETAGVTVPPPAPRMGPPEGFFGGPPGPCRKPSLGPK